MQFECANLKAAGSYFHTCRLRASNKHSGTDRAASQRLCATTSHAPASAPRAPVHQNRGGERVLRYPDGRVRHIRYPTINADSEILPDQFDVTISYDEDWDSDHWDDIDWARDVTSQWDRPAPSPKATPSHAARQQVITPSKVTFCTPSATAKQPCHAVHYFCSLQYMLRLAGETYIHKSS